MLLMCSMYLTSVNAKKVQITSATFCLLNLAIRESSAGSKPNVLVSYDYHIYTSMTI